MCSIVSGGSWYSRLLDLRRLPVFCSLMAPYRPLGLGPLELTSYESVRGRRSGEDTLAVVEGEILGNGRAQIRGLYVLRE